MKHLKHFHFASALLMLLLSALAFKGFFVGMDLMPIAIGGILVLVGLLMLLVRKRGHLNYRIGSFTALVASALLLNHVHFNVYSAERKSLSEQTSIALLKGKQAPTITFLHQLNSSEAFNFFDFVGDRQYTILNFWGTWCPPCLKEMPLLDEFYAERKQQVAVVGFTEYTKNSDRELQKIRNLVDELNISYPILIDSSTQVRTSYKANILPATVLLDHTGKVLDYQIGIDGATNIMNYVKENS